MADATTVSAFLLKREAGREATEHQKSDGGAFT